VQCQLRVGPGFGVAQEDSRYWLLWRVHLDDWKKNNHVRLMTPRGNNRMQTFGAKKIPFIPQNREPFVRRLKEKPKEVEKVVATWRR